MDISWLIDIVALERLHYYMSTNPSFSFHYYSASRCRGRSCELPTIPPCCPMLPQRGAVHHRFEPCQGQWLHYLYDSKCQLHLLVVLLVPSISLVEFVLLLQLSLILMVVAKNGCL